MPTSPPRVIAIDWSGASSGARRKIWLAEVRDGELIRLENGRNREEVGEHLLEEADREPRMVVGVDFAFSLPAWFLEERGLVSGKELWALAAREAESWLAVCDPPFWGHPGKGKPDLPEHFRRTDREAPAIGGIRPKSVFQVGGAGAVGTGSLRGMPLLHRLSAAGFSIWPFDAREWPLVIEIYPRLLTGEVVKSDAGARSEYLARHYPALPDAIRAKAASSEDAFDAAVSALVMAEHASSLASIPAIEDRWARLEGAIWYPSNGAHSATEPSESADLDVTEPTSHEPASGYGALLRALSFAARKHRDQRRKDSRTSPYINHPIRVAEILASVGGVSDPEILQAAALHDTIEDTETTPDELQSRFGPETRRLVEEVTDDKRLPKLERKRLQIEHAPELSNGAKQIKLADKIANITDVEYAAPEGWSIERRKEYLDWTEAVVAGCRGSNPSLERYYDLVLAECRASLARQEHEAVHAGAGGAAIRPDL